MSEKYYLQSISKKAFLASPKQTGIYIFWNSFKEPIYVGKAINIRNRLNSYLNVKLEPKTHRLMEEARFFAVTLVETELEALLLEAKLVGKLKTKYNIQLKDDKHPLYIKITNDKYPIIQTARKGQIVGSKEACYGPFPSSSSVKFVLKFIRKIIHYSDHLPKSKPCIFSQIMLCEPCPSSIELETNGYLKMMMQAKYKENIRLVKGILDGKASRLIYSVKRTMLKASENLNFERAARYKEILEKLSYVRQPITEIDNFIDNPNFLEDIRKVEMEDLMWLLRKYISIRSLRRIECFDVAHLMGASATASLVTFINGSQEKSLYRHFKINQKKGNSDTDSMREVAVRRFKHLTDWGRPDLIVVDGGKAQLSVFKEIFARTNVEVVGLAKRIETILVKVNLTDYHEIRAHGPGLKLLQRLRDEAHRFARVYHHNLVTKTLLETGKI